MSEPRKAGAASGLDPWAHPGLPVGVAQRAAPGEQVCGDAYEVWTSGEVVTVALADGLGHGAEAAVAAVRFCAYARAHEEDSLEQILRGAHVALTGTRGAAAAVLRCDRRAGEVRFAGVGNIEVRAYSRHAIVPVCASGVVGARVRRVVEYSYRSSRGDLLVMHTDGVASLTDLAPYRQSAPQAVADAVLARFGVAHDDATCLVLRV